MEAKVQEKEFKNIMLKNQLKVMGQMGTANVSADNVNKIMSQNELASMISSLIESQLKGDN